MIVVDASVLVEAFTNDGYMGQAAREELLDDPRWCAPAHVRVETLHAIRGRLLGGKLPETRAHEAAAAVGEAGLDLWESSALLSRMWELRDRFSCYDAAYVALAEDLEIPLVTCDGRLARAAENLVQVRLLHGD